MSQIGYMMLAAGLGVAGYAFAIFHLLTHGFFKANMFLGAGSVMHGMNDDVDMRHYGGLRKAMPVTFVTFAIGYLAIIGFPGFSGFWSKDKIIEAAFADTVVVGLGAPARRRHHRVLHDPADADDLLRREALGEGRAPARVAAGHDVPADRAGRAVGARRRAAARRLDRRLARAGRRHGGAQSCRSRRSRSASSRWRRRRRASRSRGSWSARARCRATRRRTSPSSPAPPAPTSTATRSTTPLVVARAAAGQRPVGLRPLRRRRLFTGGAVAVGCDRRAAAKVQTGYVRSYALSVLAGVLVVVLALLAVNLA